MNNIILNFKVWFVRRINRMNLNNRDFSIISNNCWGGYIYQLFALEYKTPFIGLFLYAPDYIKMLKNLKIYMEEELIFINPKESKYIDDLNKLNRLGSYPIGKINDIEIHFLHYKDESIAKSKWDRRKKRINYDNMIIKFTDNYKCNEYLIKEFDELEFQNKICFTAKPYDYESTIYIDEFYGKEYVENEWSCLKEYIDIKKILNSIK